MTHIIHACQITGDGSADTLTGDAIAKTIKADQLAWVHLDGNHPETRSWLTQELTYLDSIIIDALLAEETRPRMVEFDAGALLILRGANLNAGQETQDMISIRLWIDQHRIISIQRRPLKSTQDIHAKLSAGKGPKNAGDFLIALISRLFDRMEPVFSAMSEELDTIEEANIENRTAITELRKKAIIFRRYIAPQRDAIAHLRAAELKWLDATHRRRLQESTDQIIRYLEDLDTMRERAQIIKDELASILADKMNKNMYVLSVIAAIFLPLGFLTGLLGINVGGIPGAENPASFAIFSGILVAIVAAQIAIFKKLKWF